MSALVPLYIKMAYNEEPSFRDSKVVFSLFGEGFENKLSEGFADKIMLKGIDKNQIEEIIKPDSGFEDLCKLAISYSDGIIQNSEKVNPEMLDYAQSKGIPVLEYQSEDTYISAFNNFYDKIWSLGKEETEENED
jgi:starch synthase